MNHLSLPYQHPTDPKAPIALPIKRVEITIKQDYQIRPRQINSSQHLCHQAAYAPAACRQLQKARAIWQAAAPDQPAVAKSEYAAGFAPAAWRTISTAAAGRRIVCQ
jgi:hypothetical protein